MNADTINAEQCAQLLQCNVETAEELTRKGELPGIKFGRSWIYVKADLLTYLAEKARRDAEERRMDLLNRQQVPKIPATSLKLRRKTPPTLPQALPRASSQGQHL